MEYKKRLKIFSIFATLIITGSALVGAYYSKDLYWCEAYYFSPTSYPNSNQACPLIVTFAYLGLPSLALLLSTLPLLAFKERVYFIWWKFARISFPLIILLIFLAPTHARTGMGGFGLGFDREVAVMFFSVLFLSVSWIIMAYNTRR